MARDEARNYLMEAVEIAAGRSTLLAETAHLQALAAQQEAVLKNVQVLSEVIVSVLLDSKRTEATVNGWKLADIRKAAVTLRVHPPDAEGSVRVEIARRAPLAAGPTRVQ